MGDLPRPRWPLHPQPRPLERLDTYVRRLADTYGMGVATFCRYGLGCNVGDLDRCADDPPQALLERLSSGTGQSIRRLRNMTDARCHARTKVAARWVIRCDPEIVHKMRFRFSGHGGFVDSI
nr:MULTISPECIES: TniQ family protein [Sphingomonas]